MAEKALTTVIQEARIEGVLTHSVDGLVKAFLDRLIEDDWPYLWIDATYVKVRQNGRIDSVAMGYPA